VIVVMGIDPGVASTGFGVVLVDGATMSAADGGVIEAPAGERTEDRLARIHEALAELLAEHEPAAVALEDVYFGRNARSAIAVGQSRGVALLAAAEAGVSCFDYTPQVVKMAVCGSGAATKQQVQRMVGLLLRLSGPPRSDHAADALAVAICHASHSRSAEALDAGRHQVPVR
jgi:crossover junction endodeoxyribonuclease RuvC